ncbi:CHAT domain-containing tetratricopeptide repeat protein [Mesorhizobium sp. C395A]|nr:CHAT domain-containing tetratricopeptide repeat protein [Mesorhizobium sp. C395A]WJI76710.1 CHAT domain-containing protein [Mesorhizobium sp. C395A]
MALIVIVGLGCWLSLVNIAHAQAQAPLDEANALDLQVFDLHQNGKDAEAIVPAKRALQLRQAMLPPDQGDIARSMNNLASLYQAQGRLGEAEPLFKRALSILETTLPAGHPDIAAGLNNLAGFYYARGLLSEAEPLFKRALAVRETALPSGHPDIATSLNNLASLYYDLGRFGEAEPLFKQGLAMREALLPAGQSDIAKSVNNLAAIYKAQSRLTEAELLYRRALELTARALPAGHPDIATSLNNLASHYEAQGRLTEAEPLYKRALAMREAALPAGHPDIATSLNNLAGLYKAQGRLSKAEPLYKRGLAMREAALPAGHPYIATSLNNLAGLYHDQSRFSDAEDLYRRAQAIREAALPADHPDIVLGLHNLASLYFDQSQWVQAADHWRRSTAILAARSRRDMTVIGESQTGKGKSDADQSGDQFWGLVKAGHRIGAKSPDEDASLRHEMFQIAQWAQASEAAASLAQMAARGAKGDPTLAAMVRERQDLVSEWQALDVARTTAISQPPDKRDKLGEAATAARLATIGTCIGEIDRRLKTDFPDYAELVSVAPLASEDVQGMLGPQEALVLLLVTPAATPTPEETFIWVVTKERSTWFRSKLGELGLSERVAALRCGLDNGEWEDEAKAKRCRELLGGKRLVRRLPFNNKALAIAHELYQELLAPAEDLITGKELIIVPTGPLTALPFHILLTAPPDMTIAAITEAHRKAAWLVRSHAITMLPAVASLKALRQTTPTRTPAPEPFIGIGDPVLGETTCPSPPPLSACPKGTPSRTMIASSDRVSGRYSSSNFRGGLAEAGELNKLPRLCDTAFELRCVGTTLKADPKALLLDAAATETAVKALSSSDRLLRYRVVHFATHGLLAGQLTGGDGTPQGSQLQEAGLVLTPPPPGSETDQDDGLLTASEIAALKLNADWVILSACNTAAGDKPGTEALSGLARAFFYAGSRALLVSHWPVASSAAVEITTATLQRLQAADGSLSRAEALRRSMLELLSSEPVSPIAAPTQIDKAHPSYWAPFVLVGDGGRP